jgi:hypothetical protein
LQICEELAFTLGEQEGEHFLNCLREVVSIAPGSGSFSDRNETQPTAAHDCRKNPDSRAKLTANCVASSTSALCSIAAHRKILLRARFLTCRSGKNQTPGRERSLFGTHARPARTRGPDRTLRAHLARPGLSYRQGVVRRGSEKGR